MVMGSAWRKNNLRELRRSLGRWLAILAIIALGIGFFAGLKASKPAMLLTAEDVAAAAQTRGVAAAEGSVTADAVGTIGGDERTLKASVYASQYRVRSAPSKSTETSVK